MPRQAQGKRARAFAPALRRLAALMLAGALAGCAGGLDLGRLDTDRSILTSSIDKAPSRQPDSRVSDEAAIRAAVAAWPLHAPADTVPWVNANTGSSGAITRLADSREGASLCRTFTASRDAFGGASRYRGKACKAGGGSWIVTDLNQG